MSGYAKAQPPEAVSGTPPIPELRKPTESEGATLQRHRFNTAPGRYSSGVASTRVPALDGVRGIAVLLVVVGHISGSAAPYAGAVGVTIFFSLSGYLITGNLLREFHSNGRVDALRFYIHRIARLYPALILLLALLPVVLIIAGGDQIAGYPRVAALAAAYLSDVVLAAGRPMAYLTHTWSLSVEEQFYLVWPWLLLGLLLLAARRSRSSVIVPLGVIGICLLAFCWRLIAMAVLSPTRVYYGPDTVAFALLLGAAIAAIPPRLRPSVPPAVGLLLLAILVGVSVLVPGDTYEAANWVMVIAAITATLLLCGADRLRILSIRPLPWFGTISYGIYLWHFVLLTVQWGGAPLGGPMRLIAAVCSVLLAWLSFRYVERPSQRWIRSAFERRRLRRA